MRVLVIKGSPKKHSDTFHLAQAFLDGMDCFAAQEVEVVDVINQDIHPCLGCFGCWRTEEIRCVQNDDMNELLGKMIAADAVVWNFPLYCYGAPSHLKAVMDRTLPLEKLNMAQTADGTMEHGTKLAKRMRHVGLVGSGFPAEDERIFQPVMDQMHQLFGDFPMITVPETPLLEALSHCLDATEYTAPLLEKVKAAGTEYAKTGTLSPATLEACAQPMMPLKDYVEVVNRHAETIVK